MLGEICFSQARNFVFQAAGPPSPAYLGADSHAATVDANIMRFGREGWRFRCRPPAVLIAIYWGICALPIQPANGLEAIQPAMMFAYHIPLLPAMKHALFDTERHCAQPCGNPALVPRLA